VGSFLRGEGGDWQRVTFHMGRHFYKSVLDAAEVSEVRADRYAGHSNPSVANRYRHLLPGQLEDDAARLDEYLGGGTTGKVVRLPLAATGARAGAQAASMARTRRSNPLTGAVCRRLNAGSLRSATASCVTSAFGHESGLHRILTVSGITQSRDQAHPNGRW
jgi:hypothetical protein